MWKTGWAPGPAQPRSRCAFPHMPAMCSAFSQNALNTVHLAHLYSSATMWSYALAEQSIGSVVFSAVPFSGMVPHHTPAALAVTPVLASGSVSSPRQAAAALQAHPFFAGVDWDAMAGAPALYVC